MARSIGKYPEGAVCTAKDCNERPHSKGLCTKHYARLLRNGDAEVVTYIRCNDPARFAAAYAIKGECWQWLKPLGPTGYGAFSVGQKIYPAHRYSWTLANGPIPDGLQINHLCHNRACVNPEHLYAGTQVENMRDMREAGRSTLGRLRGEENVKAKLTEAAVKVIRASSATSASLARGHGVSESLVRAVRQRRVWTHI